MLDVVAAVENAQTRYNAGHKKRRVSTWLRKLSSRVHYYGTLMDVLVQQHPEYVALVWGAMKLLFVVGGFLRQQDSSD